MLQRVIGKKLGELLLRRKIVTQEQLEEACKAQEVKGGLIGHILVSLGYATEEDIAQALTAQYGLPYLPLAHYSVGLDVRRLIPENVARQYCLVPVDHIGNTLTIAMAVPLNTKAVNDIELLPHSSVQIFVSPSSDILQTIQRAYGSNHA